MFSGVNMRTRRQGAFPSAYAVDLEYREFDPEAVVEESAAAERRERFLLDYLGSIECLQPKGNAVLCQAVKRISSRPPPSRAAILEVSDQGIRMLSRDKNKSAKDDDNNKVRKSFIQKLTSWSKNIFWSKVIFLGPILPLK